MKPAKYDQSTTLYRIGEAKIKHIEEQLGQYASRAAKSETLSYDSSSIRVAVQPCFIGCQCQLTVLLQVTKTDTLQADFRYQTQISDGKRLLKIISTDERELATIFGEQYQCLCEALGLGSEATSASKIETITQSGEHAEQEDLASETTQKRKRAVTDAGTIVA